METSKPTNRPLSLTIIAIAQFIIAALSLAGGILLLLLLTGQIPVNTDELSEIPTYLQGLVVVGLAISGLGLVAAYGLWRLKRWGWIASLVFHNLCLLNNVLAVLTGQPVTAGVLFSALLAIAIIGGLLTPSVREACGPPISDQVTSS